MRWRFGVPPAGNANFAWVQHFIYHLAPAGIAGFVLANRSKSSNQSGEGEIRRATIEADLADGMVAPAGAAIFLLYSDPGLPVVLSSGQEERAVQGPTGADSFHRRPKDGGVVGQSATGADG